MPTEARTSATTSAESSPGGVSLAIAAFTCFVLADTCIKAVGTYHIPAYEVVPCVAVLETILLLGQAVVRGRLHDLRPRRPAGPLLRAGLDLTNNLCVVVALRHLPLALFYILVFLAPAVTTLLEAAFLSEPMGLKRWLAVTMGFLGVLVALNPLASAQSGDRIGFFACMICVACFSTSMVWSRRMTQNETPESLAFASGILQSVVGLAMARHAVPLQMRSWGLLAVTAAVSLVGTLCFFLALKRSSAATVSQFHYTQLLTGALVGYLIWRETPSASMLAGAALIVLSGVVAADLARKKLAAAPEL